MTNRAPSPPPCLHTQSTSPHTAQRIDAAVQCFVQAGFVRASEILARNRDVLDRAAHALLAKESLDEAELAGLVVGLVRSEAPSKVHAA